MVLVFLRSRLVPKIGAREAALCFSLTKGRASSRKDEISWDETGKGEGRLTIRPLGLVIKGGTLSSIVASSPLIRWEGREGRHHPSS